MRPELLTFCENFIKNRDSVKSAFPGESSYMFPVCAALFTSKGLVNLKFGSIPKRVLTIFYTKVATQAV